MTSYIYLLMLCSCGATATAFAFRPSTSSWSVQPKIKINHSNRGSSTLIAIASSHRRCHGLLPTPRQSHRKASILQMSDSIDNLPSQEEINQQKLEAYNALSSFHETSSSSSISSDSLSSSATQIDSLLSGLETIGMSPKEMQEEAAKPKYWSCDDGAIVFGVPMDPAAGLKKGVISKPYKSSVRLEMELGDLNAISSGGRKSRGLRLVESIQFDGDASLPFVRSLSLGDNVDVDAVDGSYSLDDTTITADSLAGGSSPPLPLLPPSLIANAVDPTMVKFVVEHTLAVSETERCRCFLLYGDANDDPSASNSIKGTNEDGDNDVECDGNEEDFAIMAAKKARKESKSETAERSYRLLSVVLAEETKVMPTTDKGGTASKDDDEGEEDYASDFISQMIEQSPSSSPSSPLDLLEMNQSSNAPSKEGNDMERLMQSLEKHNKQVMESATSGGAGVNDSNSNAEMERHPLGMFGLTSGVWLGDTFVREAIPSAIQSSRAGKKGFGKSSSTDKNEGDEEDRFATWSMGVQKVALRFDWDYRSSITQSFTYGKVMGTATSLSSMANIRSDGTVVVNDSRKRRREERRVVWDMENGSYVAGLVGANYFRAPRYMTFSGSRNSSGGGKDAFLTEFMVFYRPAAGKDSSKPGAIGLGISDDDVGEEYYCSRTSRLYSSKDGSMMQGSTAFFSLKQALPEE